MSTPIEVVDYDANWQEEFEKLRDQIWSAVDDVAIAIEHVGSTAVPGMTAKPIIDIDVVIASREHLPLLIQRLAAIGYKHCGNLGIEDREVFTTDSQDAHHLYACTQHSLALRNHLAVRDYLRAHSVDAAAYSALKKRLAQVFRDDRTRYVEAKTDFLVSILQHRGFSPEELDLVKGSNRAW